MKKRFEKLSREDLVELLENIYEAIESTRSSLTHTQSTINFISSSNKRRTNKNLKTLIGTIPFLLMDEMIFERNQDIASFAQTLDIQIPWPEKKKKEDMIGRIIVSISKFDDMKIAYLTNLINKITARKQYTNKDSFFADWDNAIKNIKL